MEHRREASETFERANKPGVYRCACCGERLSGPAKFYTCPRRDVRGIALPEVA